MNSTNDKSTRTNPIIQIFQKRIKTAETNKDKLVNRINRIDTYKLLQSIFLFATFLVTIFILIFTGMFGHIIADKLEAIRVDVKSGLIKNRESFAKNLDKFHPNFLIESPIHQFKIIDDGTLTIDGVPIKTQHDLDEFIKEKGHKAKYLHKLYE